ncbi:MAG: hypothetical protein JNM52_05845 [Betaproteobacteria bacterium]|nr:hypothetical protein [Betaproteobacteria bacterium]
MNLKAFAIAALAASLLTVTTALPPKPAGWRISGTSPGAFDYYSDATHSYSGKPSITLKATRVLASGYGTVMQSFDAAPFHGKRIRFSGYLKTAAASTPLMWMRVDSADNVLGFDNQTGHPPLSDQDWTPFSIVLDVSKEAVAINLGLGLRGGQAWADQLSLTAVGPEVAVTDLSFVPKNDRPVDIVLRP